MFGASLGAGTTVLMSGGAKAATAGAPASAAAPAAAVPCAPPAAAAAVQHDTDDEPLWASALQDAGGADLLPLMPFALDGEGEEGARTGSAGAAGAPVTADDDDQEVAVGRFVEMLRSAAPLAAGPASGRQQQQPRPRRRRAPTAAEREVAALAAKLRPLLLSGSGAAA
jgi:hypothetical protein